MNFQTCVWLITRTCKYITLHGKGGFVNVIKLKDLETDYIGLFRWVQGNHRGFYKRNGGRSGSEKKKLQHKQRLGCYNLLEEG